MSSVAWGGLVTEVDVDIAVVTTLRLWLPTYLTQAEQEHDLPIGTLARPKAESYSNTLDDDEFLDHRLPAVIATTAVADDVMMNGEGRHSAGFRCRVSSVARGRTPPETRAVTALFAACVRRVLIQQESLGGFAGGVRWRGSIVTALDDVTDQGRYLAAGINDFVVFVEDVVQAGAGPFIPPDPDDDPIYPPPDPDDPDEPWDPLASVTAVTVDVIPKESP